MLRFLFNCRCRAVMLVLSTLKSPWPSTDSKRWPRVEHQCLIMTRDTPLSLFVYLSEAGQHIDESIKTHKLLSVLVISNFKNTAQWYVHYCDRIIFLYKLTYFLTFDVADDVHADSTLYFKLNLMSHGKQAFSSTVSASV